MTAGDLAKKLQQFDSVLPVVWLGNGSGTADAVVDAVLCHEESHTGKFIGLRATGVSDNASGSPSIPEVQRVRDNLRETQKSFDAEFQRYYDGHSTKLEFREVKRQYDAVVSQCLDVLARI